MTAGRKRAQKSYSHTYLTRIEKDGPENVKIKRQRDYTAQQGDALFTGWNITLVRRFYEWLSNGQIIPIRICAHLCWILPAWQPQGIRQVSSLIIKVDVKEFRFVFDVFDTDNDGSIGFREFIQAVSITSHGSLDYKLEWAFRIYDLDNNGQITKQEMLKIIRAISSMISLYIKNLFIIY